MKQPVQRQPDPLLVQSGAPDATIVEGPCPDHGHVLVQYCEVLTQDLQPGLVGIYQLLVSMN
jgi:hypothetical protein